MGYTRYEPAWLMMHKIRELMGHRESQYCLNSNLEVNEIFIRTAHSFDSGDKVKRGKGSKRNTPALIAVESEKKEGDHKNGGKALGYSKIEPIDSHSSEKALRVVKKMLGLVKEITTDKGSEFVQLRQLTDNHQRIKSTETNNDQHLLWVGIITANLKRQLLGVYHSLSPNT